MFGRNTNTQSFTLMEILIIVALISTLIVGGIALINPKKQIERAWDLKRKADLSAIQKILATYSNDHESYPDSSICDDSAHRVGVNCLCHICNLKNPTISPYVETALCDPQSPGRSYLYMYDCTNPKPEWYQVCSILSYPDGETAANSYNYSIASPNNQVTNCLSMCPEDGTAGWCLKDGNCNRCSSIALCRLNNACDSPPMFFTDSACAPDSQCYPAE